MSTARSTRKIDLLSLPFPAVMRGHAGDWEIEADLDETTLRAAVAAAADDPSPDREANGVALRDRASRALSVNSAYLALPAPTNAQNVAQVHALTRECSALIRLLLGRFEATDGT